MKAPKMPLFRMFAVACLLIPAFCSLQAGDLQSKPISIQTGDWPWWRGPARNGIADPDQSPPTKWDSKTNVVWRSPIRGRGHSSVVVVAERVFLTTADRASNEQVLICLDCKTGEPIWETVIHAGGIPDSKAQKHSGNAKASFASSTVACDGNLVFANFFANRAVYATAVDLEGQIVWQTKICDYVIHQGYGSSPAIYDDLVIVSADNKGGGVIAGLNRASGKIVWKRPRPAKPNYPSPIILNVAGKDQLFLTGCDFVTSLDPLTGEPFWEVEGATTECVTSTVTDGTHVFTSGGYPKNHMSAVVADGSGKVAWENNVRTYVPSMLTKGDRLFAVLDAGVATCWDSRSGKEIWKGRLGGTFSSSPVMVGDLIYVTNEEGVTSIFRTDTDKFEKIGSNKLGESVFATPVICRDQIYMRVAQTEAGVRQEYLYCLGQ